MPDQTTRIATFLRKKLLFSPLSEERIRRLAEQCEVVSLVGGEQLYAEGDPANQFYIVWKGRMRLHTGDENSKRILATLLSGDYFGEDLFLDEERPETATAIEQANILRLRKDVLMDLLEEYPGIQETLITVAESRRFARTKKFRWLGQDEAVYMIARKHKFFLFVYLVPPALLLLVCSFFMWLNYQSAGVFTLGFILPAIFGLLSVIWMLWSWVDWSNDYYMVSNQRVLWIEKVVALYNSQQEAPLDTILSTNKVINQTLRVFIDYGTLVVRTYTGSIVMNRSEKPDQILYFIDGLRSRARELAKETADEAMNYTIQRRLGVSTDEQDDADAASQVSPRVVEQPKGLGRYFPNFFRLRIVKGETITYRKHWFVLIKKTWLPALVNFGLFLLAVYLWISGIFLGPFALLVWALIFALSGFWWFYHYLDWRDDTYVLTYDDVIDIDRKPFSREEKRVASLGNILSLEHARVGVMGVLLNYGTVSINVGTEKLTFDNVVNPVQVQYEIFDRMYAFRRRKEENEAEKERDRVADWLIAYHQQVQRLEDLENDTGFDPFSR